MLPACNARATFCIILVCVNAKGGGCVPRYEMTAPKNGRDYTWRVCVATSIAYAVPFATCLRCELAVVCVAYRRSEENMLKNSDKSLSVLCVFANGGRLGRKFVKNGVVL